MGSNKSKAKCSGRVTFDSGAVVSVIHEKMLEYCDYEPTGTRVKEYLGAGGHTLDLLPHVVDVSVHVRGIGMVVFRKVLVLSKNARVTRTLLVGRSDLRRLKVRMDFGSSEVWLGSGEQRRKLEMQDKKTSSVKNVKKIKSRKKDKSTSRKQVASRKQTASRKHVASRKLVLHERSEVERKMNKIFEDFLDAPSGRDICSVEEGQYINRVKRDFGSIRKHERSPEDPLGIQQKHEMEEDGLSTEAICGESCMYTKVWCSGCEHCIDKKVEEWLQQNKEAPEVKDQMGQEVTVTLQKYIERLRQRSRSTYTHKDCTIDERFRKKHPRVAKKIDDLIEEYKDIFASDIGKVSEEYAATAEITGKTSPQRPGHQEFQGTTLKAILKQFAKQIADGVLVDVQKAKVVPKNFLQVLPIKKKDDDGKVLDVVSSLRVVVNSTPVNGKTEYKGVRTDNLNDSTNFAASTSRKGFNIKADIGDAFYAIPLKKEHWGYFCIEVPFLGTFCYTRIVQGWAPSAQICQEVFARIFFELKDFMRRYMDDLIIATEGSEEDYLHLVKRFFQIVRMNNLRLKGKKCFFGATAFNFLGVLIKDGKIQPSPHYVEKLEQLKPEDIVTKTQLRSFAYSFTFISKFFHRSSELLDALRRVISGNGKDRVVWTDELRAAFHKVQRALREMVQVYPFEPELQTVLVVDTSKEATGGFIYQIGDEGPRLVSFFSRTRKDRERKITLSSCHIELMGLKVMVLAFIPLLRQAKKTIIAVTDSAPTVQIWAKFKKYELPSHDTRINNALYVLASSVDLNIVHAKNTNDKLKFADMLSRLKIIREAKPCEGEPKCPICKAANVDDTDRPTIIQAIQEMTEIEKDHHKILLDSRTDGINLVPDEWAFKPYRYREPEGLGSLKEDKPWTLRELLESPKELRAIQSNSKDLRTLAKSLSEGRVSFPKKLQRLQTMLEKRNASIEDGVIYMDKSTGGVTRRVIPIPDRDASKIILAVHRTVGHGPVTQTVHQVNRYFEISKPREKVDAILKKCVKCVLMRGGANYRKQMKPVPMPKDMFRSVLADEITRPVRGKELKILIAMEAWSGFMVAVVYEGAMNGEKFIAAMAHVKAVLCPHNMDELKIELRCDKATWHTGSLIREGLTRMGIDLRVHSSVTMSRNIIPELDVKIKNYSLHLIQAIEDLPKSLGLGLPCHVAAAKCNNTIGSSGYTPAELFVGRGWKNNETIQLDVKKILENVAKRREQRRQYEDRKRLKVKQRKELQLIPYEEDELNSDLVRNPDLVRIKEKDIVTLRENFNKNEPKSAYVVVKIDFRKRQALLRRESGLDSGPREPKWICFSRIDEVFPDENLMHRNRIASVRYTELTEKDFIDKQDAEAAIMWQNGKKNKFMMAMAAAINMFSAPTEGFLNDSEYVFLSSPENPQNMAPLRASTPDGVNFTPTGPRMVHTPTTLIREASISPGTISPPYEIPILGEGHVPETDSYHSSFESITKESLEKIKREHPAAALERLTVIKRTPEPSPRSPQERKDSIRNRLKKKIEAKRESRMNDILSPEGEPEGKPKVEPKIEPKIEPKSEPKDTLENESEKEKKSVAKGKPKNKRIKALSQPEISTPEKKMAEVLRKAAKRQAKSKLRKETAEKDESPVRPTRTSNRTAARTGQRKGAFSDWLK